MFAFFRITFQWCQSGRLFIAFLARAFVLQTIALGVKVKPANMNEIWTALRETAKLFMFLANISSDFIFLWNGELRLPYFRSQFIFSRFFKRIGCWVFPNFLNILQIYKLLIVRVKLQQEKNMLIPNMFCQEIKSELYFEL